ncbi:ABC transporter substrate-binding protein [Thalassotalea crassostreae]|uniref:ABC transporter substrate-binding protein n=1 Tax=Thalassotalea crassostreae TaxID=1763536 RepID=UPI0009EF61FF|nr:ABC transporter substrate-binding protein [Thalassotalea crassostreae]
MMKLIKNIILSAVLFGSLFSASASAATEVDKSDPYKMIEEVSVITFKRFADEEAEIKKNPEILKDIVREELMPYIFYQYAAAKVLGVHLKGTKQKPTSREDVQAFMLAFREYLITSYAQVFTLYEQQEVIFEPPRKIDAKQKIVVVGVNIIDDDRPPISIQFKVRKNAKIKGWQAYDLVAEGISLLDAKQKELRSILAEKGVANVTEMLKEKSQRKIVFKDGPTDIDKKLKEQED